MLPEPALADRWAATAATARAATDHADHGASARPAGRAEAGVVSR